MEVIRKLSAAYMVAVAVVVAVWFIVNSFFVDSFNVLNVWYALDVLMLIGLALALIFNYDRKRKEGKREPGEAVSRRYLEVNAAFYLTAGIAILFLHSWFSLLALGDERSLGLGSDLGLKPPGLGSSGRWWTPCFRWSSASPAAQYGGSRRAESYERSYSQSGVQGAALFLPLVLGGRLGRGSEARQGETNGAFSVSQAGCRGAQPPPGV